MIRFNEDNIRFTPEQNQGIIRFRGTGIEWETISISNTQYWCTTEIHKETATDGRIDITVDANEGEDRSCVINIIATDVVDGEQSYILQVNQEGNAAKPYFTINPTTINLNSSEQYFYTTYSAYRINDIVANINVDWIKETEPFRYIAEYNGEENRTATITYTAYFDNGTTQNRTLTVTQTGVNKEVILSQSTVELDYNIQDEYITASIKGVEGVSLISQLPEWLFVNVAFNDDKSVAEIQIGVDYNSSHFDREFTVVWDFDGIEVSLKVIQKGNIEYLEFPIWKDTEIDFGGDANYRVVDADDNVIYEGRAYGGSIYINRILKSYVDNEIDLFNIEYGGRFMSNNSYKTFKVQMLLNNDYSDYSIVKTYYDYSYDLNNTNHQLSKPISNIIDDRQIFLITGLNGYTDDAMTLMFQNHTPNPHTSGGITRYFELEKGIYTYMYDKLVPNGIITDYSGNEQHFQVKRTCAKYACYYLNKYGGWDSMLFMGRSTKETVANTILQYKRDINNSQIDFQTIDYQRTKRISLKLNTNYLTDKQSSMMHLLLDSNKVYLHNLETNEIIPATIKTNSYEVKTYFNQGRKLFTYNIEFEHSSEQVIR